MRPPSRQITAKTYLIAVDGYRHYLHPISSRYIHCRYTPTCSHYSQQAVQKYGIFRGLYLTARRLISCRSSVPFGTYNPIPPS